jgi:hypothetical protein
MTFPLDEVFNRLQVTEMLSHNLTGRSSFCIVLHVLSYCSPIDAEYLLLDLAVASYNLRLRRHELDD